MARDQRERGRARSRVIKNYKQHGLRETKFRKHRGRCVPRYSPAFPRFSPGIRVASFAIQSLSWPPLSPSLSLSLIFYISRYILFPSFFFSLRVASTVFNPPCQTTRGTKAKRERKRERGERKKIKKKSSARYDRDREGERNRVGIFSMCLSKRIYIYI